MILMLLGQGANFKWHWSRLLRIMVLMLDRLGLYQFSELLFEPSLPNVLMAPVDLSCGTNFLYNNIARPLISLAKGKREICLLQRT